MFTYTVLDGDDNTAPADSPSLTFNITVELTAPTITASVPALAVVVGTAIEPVTIDASSGGAVASYSISPDISNGLSFDTTSGTLSGTPSAAAVQ